MGEVGRLVSYLPGVYYVAVVVPFCVGSVPVRRTLGTWYHLQLRRCHTSSCRIFVRFSSDRRTVSASLQMVCSLLQDGASLHIGSTVCCVVVVSGSLNCLNLSLPRVSSSSHLPLPLVVRKQMRARVQRAPLSLTSCRSSVHVVRCEQGCCKCCCNGLNFESKTYAPVTLTEWSGHSLVLSFSISSRRTLPLLILRHTFASVLLKFTDPHVECPQEIQNTTVTDQEQSPRLESSLVTFFTTFHRLRGHVWPDALLLQLIRRPFPVGFSLLHCHPVSGYVLRCPTKVSSEHDKTNQA